VFLVQKLPTRPDLINKITDASYAWNCDPGKFTTKFSQTLCSGTFRIATTIRIEKLAVQHYGTVYTHTHSNNQYLTQSLTQLHCSVNNLSGSCCMRLATSLAVPIGSRQLAAALWFVIVLTLLPSLGSKTIVEPLS